MIKAALKDGMVSFTTGGERSLEKEPMNPIRSNELKPAYHDGKPLSPTELRALCPHAPVKNGVRICWGHPAWSGCAKGGNVHTTIR